MTADLKAGIEALEAAAREFVAKVQRGDARSVHSFAAFKAALAKMDQARAEAVKE